MYSWQVQLQRGIFSGNHTWWCPLIINSNSICTSHPLTATPFANQQNELLSWLMSDKPFWDAVPVSGADGIPCCNYGGKRKQLILLCGPIHWKGHWSVDWMDALGITINPLSPQRNPPISPTVPFPSNQYGDGGSRRDDTDEPQFFPTEPGRGMLGGGLLSYAATPLALVRLGCWENGHGFVEVRTV